MTVLGATVAMFDGERVLLTKREDFAVWCLPGGGVDAGESIAAAAVREAREETGLVVELSGLIGVYSRPHWNRGGLHLLLFSAQIVGGTLAPNPAEVSELGYFAATALPSPIMWGHQQMIHDAVHGVRGVAWTLHARWPYPHDLARPEIYALRDRSGLSRAEFYQRHLTPHDWQDQTLEAGASISPC